MAIPLENVTAEDVARKLEEHWPEWWLAFADSIDLQVCVRKGYGPEQTRDWLRKCAYREINRRLTAARPAGVRVE